MSRVLSFGFATNPAAPTDESTCTINWSAQTVSFPGDTAVSFDAVDQLVADLQRLAGQSVADNQVDTESKVYRDDGSTLDIVLKAVGTPASGITTVSTGAADITPAKALDLAAGLQEYVLDEIAP